MQTTSQRQATCPRLITGCLAICSFYQRSSVGWTKFGMGFDSWAMMLMLANSPELSTIFFITRIFDGLCTSAAAVSRQEPPSHVSFPPSPLADGLFEGRVLRDLVSHGAGWADHPPGSHHFQKHSLRVSATLTAVDPSQAGIAGLELTLFLRQMCVQRCES